MASGPPQAENVHEHDPDPCQSRGTRNLRTYTDGTIRPYVMHVCTQRDGGGRLAEVYREVRTHLHTPRHSWHHTSTRTYVRGPTVKTTPSVRNAYELMCMRAHCESCRGLALRRYAVALPPAPQPPLVDLVTHVPRDDHGMMRPVRSAMRVIARCV